VALARKSKSSQKWLIGLAIAFLIALIFRLSRKNQWSGQLIQASKYKSLEPYLLAQAKFETNNFTSRLATQYNNLFGMNCVKVRPTTQTGCTQPEFDGGMSKGIYSSWSKSIEDQLLYLDYSNAPTTFETPESFVQWLKFKGYFTGDLKAYINGIKRWM